MLINIQNYTFYPQDVEFVYEQETSYHEKTHVKLKTGMKIFCDYKDTAKVKKAMNEYSEKINAHNVMIHESYLL